AEKDRVFAQDQDSPLTPDDRHAFKGLVYFDENPGLIISATVDRNVEEGEVRMATSTGEEQVYRRYGIVRFSVEGHQAQLTLYASEDSDELFVPFCHAASVQQTYAAGRYLD